MIVSSMLIFTLFGLLQATFDVQAFALFNVPKYNCFGNKVRELNHLELAASRLISSFDQSSDFSDPTGEWPYQSSDFARLDASNDINFYKTPRFVTHIDDGAIQSLTEYYQEQMSKSLKEKTFLSKQEKNSSSNHVDKLDILDMCSSWISHLPVTNDDVSYGRVVGIGLNEQELKENSQLTEYYVQNLNENPSLAELFDDNSFDVICNVVSVDYLTRPLPIFQEMHRILRPNGVALISFSNRCFPTKAISMWLREDDIGRLSIVASYFHYAASWSSIEAYDIKSRVDAAPPRPSFTEIMADPSKGLAWLNTAAAVAKVNSGDPMYVVKAVK